MTTIEKIKAEIERLKATNPSEYNYQNAEGYVWALDDILSFLSTLESEKPMNLEEEINRYLHEECSDDDEPGIHEIAEHFAQWGVEHAREQMMKGAVEGVIDDCGTPARLRLEMPGGSFRIGDKVKLIIVKED